MAVDVNGLGLVAVLLGAVLVFGLTVLAVVGLLLIVRPCSAERVGLDELLDRQVDESTYRGCRKGATWTGWGCS